MKLIDINIIRFKEAGFRGWKCIVWYEDENGIVDAVREIQTTPELAFKKGMETYNSLEMSEL